MTAPAFIPQQPPVPPLALVEDDEEPDFSFTRPDDTEAMNTQGIGDTELLNDLGVPERAQAGGEDEETAKLALAACYTEDFPLLKAEPKDEDWISWARGLWNNHSAGVWRHLHQIEYNRRMRDGDQWISCIGYGPWVEPPKPKDAARMVDNVIAPALDQRVEIVSEQRPGFRCAPDGAWSQKRAKKAEAQQQFLEYQYKQQNMRAVIREAAYWAGTDGVSFVHKRWDTEAGTWDEIVAEDGTTEQIPLGELRSEVFRVEHVRVSADASANVRPKYWVCRRVLSRGHATRLHGAKAAKGMSDSLGITDTDIAPSVRSSVLYPDYDELLQGQETVEEFIVYCDKTEYLKGGLCLKIIGDEIVVQPMPLPWGIVPIARFTDGSTDPAFYPKPIMNGWSPLQIAINGLKTKQFESIRINSGGKVIVRQDALVAETMTAGAMALWEYKGAGDIRDAVMPLSSFSVGQDVDKALQAYELRYGQVSGWNDTTRGNYTGDPSGRAILAQRETVERIFTPPVVATCDGMVEWAKIALAACAIEYVTERIIAIEGEDRPDLTRAISEQDLNGISEVSIDPETMMPLPYSMRLYLLDENLAKGIITPAEYRRRHPLGFVKNMHTPDNDHHARAMRVIEAIRESGDPMAIPILWQDNEAIHQDALERELILPDDIDPMIRQAADARWKMLAQQGAMKAMTMPMPGAPPMQGSPGGAGKPGGMPPQSQPFQGTNPAIAASTKTRIGGGSDEQAAASEFEKRSPS